MITVHRACERRHDRRRRQEVWHSFCPEAGALPDGFGALELLNEDRLSPGASIAPRPHRASEIITYVREGALLHEDSMGRSGIIRAGEFQSMSTGRGIRHGERNASRRDWAHVFQIGLRASRPGLEHDEEQKRFSVADRRGGLCLVASPDARKGSLRLHQDALVYSAMLEPGQHVAHELLSGRSAWLHLVQGEATLDGILLAAGDGAGLTAERAVSLTARGHTEVLLLDLGEQLAARRRHQIDGSPHQGERSDREMAPEGPQDHCPGSGTQRALLVGTARSVNAQRAEA